MVVICPKCHREFYEYVLLESHYCIPKQNINYEDTPKEILLIKSFANVGQEIGQLVDEKNKQYGDSFNKCGDFLKILYPDGVKPEQYADMLGVTRIFDKLMRIANGNQGEENAWRDLAGYGILKSKEEVIE